MEVCVAANCPRSATKRQKTTCCGDDNKMKYTHVTYDVNTGRQSFSKVEVLRQEMTSVLPVHEHSRLSASSL